MANKVMGVGYLIVAALAFFAATSPKYTLWGAIVGIAALVLSIHNFTKKGW